MQKVLSIFTTVTQLFYLCLSFLISKDNVNNAIYLKQLLLLLSHFSRDGHYVTP